MGNLENLKSVQARLDSDDFAEVDATQKRFVLVTQIIPKVQAILLNVLNKYGFEESTLMNAVMQIQRYAIAPPGDTAMQESVQRVMAFLQGRFDEIGAEEQKAHDKSVADKRAWYAKDQAKKEKDAERAKKKAQKAVKKADKEKA